MRKKRKLKKHKLKIVSKEPSPNLVLTAADQKLRQIFERN